MILISGANGYIGRNLIELLKSKELEFIGIDNFSTSKQDNFSAQAKILKLDVQNTKALVDIMHDFSVSTVIHLAASAYVGESMKSPEKYLRNNVLGTLSLLEAMQSAKVSNLIFSSSCAVYGGDLRGILESHLLIPASPYGHSKLMAEMLIQRYCSLKDIRAVVLRFFNVVGGQENGAHIDLHSPEPHLLPNLVGAAISGDDFNVFGVDYSTPDGTPVRDYTHVRDIARGLYMSSEWLNQQEKGVFEVFNLGSGNPLSVLQVINLVEEVSGKRIKFSTMSRREGDADSAFAVTSKARRTLSWQSEIDLQTAVFEQLRGTLGIHADN
jgi:UDP-glucose 4-epimerase